MSQIQVVGFDLAKQVFQVHAIAAGGSVDVVRTSLRTLRRPTRTASEASNLEWDHDPGEGLADSIDNQP